MPKKLSTTNYFVNRLNTYKEQEILMSSPEECVLHLYDAAIQSCTMGQEERAGKALAALINALDHNADGEIAAGFFRLYEYCLNSIHRQQFETSSKILRGLRQAWHEAIAAQVAA